MSAPKSHEVGMGDGAGDGGYSGVAPVAQLAEAGDLKSPPVRVRLPSGAPDARGVTRRIWLATRPLAGTAQGLATPDSWWGWWWPHLLVVASVSAPAFWWWMRRRALRPQVTIRSEGPAA